MDVPDVEYIVPPPGFEDDLTASPESQKSQTVFKKHRVLPHPGNGNGSGAGSGTPDSRRSSSGGQSHHTLRHQRRRISGGDLPPTPPAHSRTSSGSHSVNLSVPSPLQTPVQSLEDVPSKANPSTPPMQRSPPTPDVTPPQQLRQHQQAQAQATSRPKPPTLRPTLYDRIPSKSTTDSRSESFTTARESPVPSDEDDGRSTLRPAPISTRASQDTVRQAIGNGSEHRTPQSRLDSGLDLEPNLGDDQSALTPKPKKGEFTSFDGEWGLGNDEVEQERDGNLMRNVTVGKRRPSKQANGQTHEVVDDFAVSPTNATRTVRGIPLHGRILTYDDSPLEAPLRSFTAPEVDQDTFEAAIDADIRRFSGMSSRSAASTVVEAILVENPPRPQRRTLRHVKRVNALRDSIWHSPPRSSAPTLGGAVNPRRQSGDRAAHDAPRESYASSTTVNSVSSRKARREVWKNGGVPVVVVPDRLSSHKSSSREHSLRSSSSKRSRRSQSLGSAPLEQMSNDHDLTAYFDRPPRREQLMTESDGSTPGDQRTMDFPPTIPQRSTSLSAPGSRNASRAQSRDASRSESRAGSLTAESLRAHNAMQAKLAKDGFSSVPSLGAVNHIVGETPSIHGWGQGDLPVVTVHAVPSLEQTRSSDQEESEGQQRHLDSGSGDPMLSAKATPFSQASVETTGTSSADIGEARAVSMVPHKIRSVVIRPSEGSDGEQRSPATIRPDRPTITTTEVDGVTQVHEMEPATPSQARSSLEDVDSPLRNPRIPPEPPAIQFIPATPSGLTPSEEKAKMLGNFYEEDLEEKPARSPSVVRRALGKRRQSSRSPSPARKARPSFLARTFSLSRNVRKDTTEFPDPDYMINSSEPDDIDETRLHPDWRPSYFRGYDDDDDDYDYGVFDLDDDEDNNSGYRPALPPRRTLGERMKRTFAIMPLQQDDADGRPPDRRTLARTSSGNLRVVKKRGSAGSLWGELKKDHHHHRPSTAPSSARRSLSRSRPFWPSRSNSLVRKGRGQDQGQDDRQCGDGDSGVTASASSPGNGKKGAGAAADHRDRDRDRDRDRAMPPRTSETRRWSVSQNIGTLTRRLSEKRRERRSNELRGKISGPREVRDTVGDVIHREGFREAFLRPRGAGAREGAVV